MAKPETIEMDEAVLENIRLKLTERDCPRCEAVLVHNDNEVCYECLNCGYIDCGDEIEDK